MSTAYNNKDKVIIIKIKMKYNKKDNYEGYK